MVEGMGGFGNAEFTSSAEGDSLSGTASSCAMSVVVKRTSSVDPQIFIPHLRLDVSSFLFPQLKQCHLVCLCMFAFSEARLFLP